MTLAFSSDQSHPLVDELLRRQDGAAAVDRSIDAEDEMLLFARAIHGSDEDAALAAYFRDGWSVFSAMSQVAAWRPGGFPGMSRMLDFASGFGRVTRFLAPVVGRERLWVSDIYRDAMEFQRRVFGVHAILSTTRPDEFQCTERFDFIFVTSLFTHLPEATFRGWLERLIGLLVPGGLLAFSVHDESLLPPGGSMPPSGIHFQASSESRSLDPQAYGSTWVSEGYVRATAAALAPGGTCVRLPFALGRFQDLYVLDLAGGPERRPFDPGPFGQLDRCEYRPGAHGAGRLALRGWAAQSVRGQDLAALRVRLGGVEVAELRRFEERADVRAYFPEAGSRSGFELDVPLPPAPHLGSLPLVLEGETTGGVRGAIEACTVGQAFLRLTRAALATSENQRRHEEEVSALRIRQLELEGEALRARIGAMEASRFWKLRNAWFALKRAAGLTLEK